jgi:hypothetical protein
MPTASGLAVQQLQPKSKSPGSSSEGSGKVSSIPRVDPRALDNIPEDGISATAMEPNVQLLQPAGKLKKPGSDSSCEAAVLVVENAAATSSSSSSGGGKPSAAMSKPYVMLKCFTMLAQQSANSCILPVAQLLEHLSQKRCLLSMEQLIELVLEQQGAHLFQLGQDSEGRQLYLRLRLPIKDQVLQHLISLGANVTVIPAVVNQDSFDRAQESSRPTARVTSSTVVIDGLHGFCFHRPEAASGDNMALIVLEFATCLLSWPFAATPAIVQCTGEEGQPVLACLRIYPVGRPDVQVDLLSLTFVDGSKLFLPEGKGFNFQKGTAIPMTHARLVLPSPSPPFQQYQEDSSLYNSIPLGEPNQTAAISVTTLDNQGQCTPPPYGSSLGTVLVVFSALGIFLFTGSRSRILDYFLL